MSKLIRYLLYVLIIAFPLNTYGIRNTKNMSESWSKMAKKMKFFYDRHPSFVEFGEILQAKDAWDLQEKMEEMPSNKSLSEKLLIGICDVQWNATFFAEPQWAIGQMLKTKFYFTEEEIAEAVSFYLNYRTLRDQREYKIATEEERKELQEWEINGYPIFTEFEKDNLQSPKISVNIEAILRRIIASGKSSSPEQGYMYLQYPSEKTEITFSVTNDGAIKELSSSGIYEDLIRFSDFTCKEPAYYLFEHLDTIVAIPSVYKTTITEYIRSTENSFDVRVKYDKKKKSWKVNDIYDRPVLTDNAIQIINDKLNNLPIDSDYRKGWQSFGIHIWDRWIEYDGSNYQLPQIVKFYRL